MSKTFRTILHLLNRPRPFRVVIGRVHVGQLGDVERRIVANGPLGPVFFRSVLPVRAARVVVAGRATGIGDGQQKRAAGGGTAVIDSPVGFAMAIVRSFRSSKLVPVGGASP